ncbi:serine/threonine-protein kinase [Corynebacterium glucuronolyticum]|uniref:Serine/threonine protein kinase n=2 Tax=Corynebacterium glucuronolyticum TaxID=39791 RepID=A0AAX1L8Q0_9CORY|nr:serine/threonine-protein kinase [Corynebacterium glucuronolyticum]EEI61871.1 hypothetical protein HMPREF0293_2605 [Corynebacterium glucuronolyticum ATCC 51866]QRP70583.1 serine/threonine protein kinase [Corynebacterium glucuronolyticum]
MQDTFIEEVSARHGLTRMQPLHGGEGGMGKVYVAEQPRFGRRLAIKRLSTDNLLTNSSRETANRRFQQEMQILGNLHKESIVAPIEAGVTSQNVPYFTMTFVPGEDLQKVIQRRVNQRRPFTPEETADLLAPIGNALDYIHTRPQPIVHRDVKPANIIIPNDDNFAVPSVLTDFGIAVKRGVERLTATNVSVGTQMYMSPESYTTASPSSDNYALALVAYEMITLRPFKRPTEESRGQIPLQRKFDEDLGSRSLNRVFGTALAVKEKDRYNDCHEFLVALRNAKPPKDSAETAFETHAYEYTKTSDSAVKKKTWPWAAGGAALVLLVLAAIPVLNGAFSSSSTWTGAEQTIARAFPGIVPDAPGESSPWQGFSCDSATSEGDPYTSISCSSRRGHVVIADFGNSRERARYVSSNNAETLANDSCTIQRTQYGEDLAILPEGDRQQFAILISGKNAEQLSLEVPLC